MSRAVSPQQLARFRARATHLDRRVDSLAEAARGGLQDSAPRAGVIALHARARDVTADSWDDRSLAQIWFRRGADYIVPRDDVGIFTLGCYPRDPDAARTLEDVADAAHRILGGRTLKTSEVYAALGIDQPLLVRAATATGRLLIRWNASMIWLIPVERPDLDVEDARRELARRFLRWFGPQTVEALQRWTGVSPPDASATWAAIRSELEPVEIGGEPRHGLAADLDSLRNARAISGVRLLPADDPWTKLDRHLIVQDARLRAQVFPAKSPGYIPGAIVVDGEIAGGWQRQQRAVTLHPAKRLAAAAREALEVEALSLPIAAKTKPSVAWDE